MKPTLMATVTPRQWSAEQMQDVTFRFEIHNSGSSALEIFPKTIALKWLMSQAGLGMEWDLAFAGMEPGARSHGVELRTYYGPPGEPVNATWLESTRLRLEPGAKWNTTLTACWIPRRLLVPASLDPATLDPKGYDNIEAARIDLTQASVLVFGSTCESMRAAMAAGPEFLRGHVVVFFDRAGQYALQATYRQQPILYPFVQTLTIEAAPITLDVGAK